MLEATLAPQLPPGSNRRGHRAGAAWTYVLPRRDLGRTLCLGPPTPPALATLTGISRKVHVLDADRATQRAVAGLEPERVRSVALTPDGRLELPDASVDLAVATPSWTRRMREPRFQEELRRLLVADGHLWAEESPQVPDDWTQQRLWLLTLEGEVLAAAPFAASEAITYVSSLAGKPSAPRPRLAREVRRLLRGRPGPSQPLESRGLLVAPGDAADLRQPPRYLVDTAAAAGVAISEHRWGLLDPGFFRTKKVLIFLFPPGETRPDYVVKLTRDALFNERLVNEERGLVELRARGLGGLVVAPRAAFAGDHAGLTFLAETIVDGTPFRKVTTFRHDCPHAFATVDWLTELGARSATPASAATVAACLRTLLDRCTATYALEPRHKTFLAAQLNALGEHPAPFPLVYQHGDTGPWNLLVDEAGRLAVLDWEAADPQGVPLWDLFYFLRSYGVGAARHAGIRGGQRGFERHYFRSSALGDLLVGAVERYCARVGLAHELVEPLFYLCWVHRSLKEAKSKSPSRVDRGRYITLLRRCIDARESPGLRRLFTH